MKPLAVFYLGLILVNFRCLWAEEVSSQAEHPAKALFLEVQALKKLPPAARSASQKSDLAAKIKACRENVNAYTRSHSGKDLDAWNWGSAFQGIYCLSSGYEWPTYKEAENCLREGWMLLGQAQPENPKLVPHFCVQVTLLYVQPWCRREPEACMALLDEACLKFSVKSDPELLHMWQWFVPGFEQEMLLASSDFPPERRAPIQQKLQASFLNRLVDESIPLNERTSQVARQASILFSQGESSRAAALLDEWWNKYGEKIASADFYSARFFAACLGEGDWAKAHEMVQRVSKLVAAGSVPPNNPFYKMMINAYYANITHSEYELKRRATIGNAEKKAKIQNGTTSK